MDAVLKVRGHYRLEVWRQGIELVKGVYWVTKKFPTEEQFGLRAVAQGGCLGA